MILQIRKRTKPEDIAYSLYLYFLGLSLRNTSKALSRFVKRSHTAIRDWIQKHKPERIFSKKIQIAEFIIDEIQIKVGSEYIWLWVAVIEHDNRETLQIKISKERNNMFVGAERFLSNLVKRYGEHPVSTDGGGTWYHQACRFLKLQHHIHSPFEKSIKDRTMQYIKDRTMQYIKDRTMQYIKDRTKDCFDDYFPCNRKNKCKLQHIQKWLNLFVDHYNKEMIS